MRIYCVVLLLLILYLSIIPFLLLGSPLYMLVYEWSSAYLLDPPFGLASSVIGWVPHDPRAWGHVFSYLGSLYSTRQYKDLPQDTSHENIYKHIKPATAENSGDAGVSVSIGVEAPIPGHRCYRGCNFALEAVIHNGLGEPVNISIGTMFEPFTAKWSNYSSAELDPGESIVYAWILWAPRNISYGNYTLGLNITCTVNSTTYNIYREAWIEIIPRNVSLLVADLTRNTTGYYLVVRNPTTDPGQYIVENITVTLTAYNVSISPREAFIKKLHANRSYTIPLTINFTETDIGALLVNITTHDDVHGLVYFNYTFIVVNATAYLDLHVIDDCGRPLDNATVIIDGETYFTDENGSVSLVLPIGIYNYTVIYNEHRVSGKLFLHTGHNRYTVVVDLTPPVIKLVKQRGYGILVKAWDPGPNSAGISKIVFIQGDSVWSYSVGPSRNVSLLLYPPLKTGETVVVVVDGQGNCVNTTIYYAVPGRPNAILEFIIVLSIASLLLIVVLLLLTYR